MSNDTIDAAAEVQMIRIMEYRDGRLSPEEAAAVAAEIANHTMKASTETASRAFLSPVLRHGPSQQVPASGWTPLLVDFSSPIQDSVLNEIFPKKLSTP